MSPILGPQTIEFFSRSPDQTRRVGMRLGAMLEKGDVLSLVGDLGAGKTTLVQGIAAGWGSLDVVTSPTFILINTYRRLDGGLLHHLDAYRINNAEEAEDLDIDTLLATGPLVIEWADRISRALPEEGLWIHMEYQDNSHRLVQFSAIGPRFEHLLLEIRQGLYGV